LKKVWIEVCERGKNKMDNARKEEGAKPVKRQMERDRERKNRGKHFVTSSFP